MADTGAFTMMLKVGLETTFTMRYVNGHFVVVGHISLMRFKSRAEAMDYGARYAAYIRLVIAN